MKPALGLPAYECPHCGAFAQQMLAHLIEHCARPGPARWPGLVATMMGRRRHRQLGRAMLRGTIRGRVMACAEGEDRCRKPSNWR